MMRVKVVVMMADEGSKDMLEQSAIEQTTKQVFHEKSE